MSCNKLFLIDIFISISQIDEHSFILLVDKMPSKALLNKIDSNIENLVKKTFVGTPYKDFYYSDIHVFVKNRVIMYLKAEGINVIPHDKIGYNVSIDL